MSRSTTACSVAMFWAICSCLTASCSKLLRTALISGAVSQAIRLGLFPRLNLLHTHERHADQIYIPFVNWSLFAGCKFITCGSKG